MSYEFQVVMEEDSKWYDGLLEVVCGVLIMVALILAHSK